MCHTPNPMIIWNWNWWLLGVPVILRQAHILTIHNHPNPPFPTNQQDSSRWCNKAEKFGPSSGRRASQRIPGNVTVMFETTSHPGNGECFGVRLHTALPYWVPSGHLSHSYWKWQVSTEKSTISIAIFNSYVTNDQRVYPIHNPLNHYKVPLNSNKSPFFTMFPWPMDRIAMVSPWFRFSLARPWSAWTSAAALRLSNCARSCAARSSASWSNGNWERSCGGSCRRMELQG